MWPCLAASVGTRGHLPRSCWALGVVISSPPPNTHTHFTDDMEAHRWVLRPNWISASCRQCTLTPLETFPSIFAEGCIPPPSPTSLSSFQTPPPTISQTTRDPALIRPHSVFWKGCVFSSPGHCSCCSLSLECASLSPFIPGQVSSSFSCSSLESGSPGVGAAAASQCSPFPLDPPSGPVVKLLMGLFFCGWPVQGWVGGSST